MIITDIKNIKLNNKCKVMSLDVSKNNIGVAISTTSLTLGFPYKIIKRTKFLADIKKIQEIIKLENIGLIVLGLPLEKDGSMKQRAQSIKTFASLLDKHLDLPITFQDERFSTLVIEQNTMNNNKESVDDQAAAWFLQIFLDKLKHN